VPGAVSHGGDADFADALRAATNGGWTLGDGTQLRHGAVRFSPEKMGYQRLRFLYRKVEVPSENAT
jgi:hypothetical protein